MTIAPLACVILAGGKGTRMKSSLPKLLHEACGRTLIDWTLRRGGASSGPSGWWWSCRPTIPQLVEGLPEWAVPAVQAVARGTGDAVASARTALEGFTAWSCASTATIR